MIRLKQTIRHNPDAGTYGNCFPTCFAMILDEDIEVIPHFCDPRQFDDHKDAARKFLRSRDLDLFTIIYPGDTSFEDVVRTVGHYNPGVPAIVTGVSPRGVNHCVVVMDGEVFCDPFDGTPNQEPFTGCADPSGVWWVEVVTVKVE